MSREVQKQIDGLTDQLNCLESQIDICDTDIEELSTELLIKKRSKDELYKQYRDIVNELDELKWEEVQKEENLKKKRVKRLKQWGILENE